MYVNVTIPHMDPMGDESQSPETLHKYNFCSWGTANCLRRHVSGKPFHHCWGCKYIYIYIQYANWIDRFKRLEYILFASRCKDMYIGYVCMWDHVHAFHINKKHHCWECFPSPISSKSRLKSPSHQNSSRSGWTDNGKMEVAQAVGW